MPGFPSPRPESGLMTPSTLPVRARPSPAILRVFGARPFHTDGEIVALAFADDGSLWTVEEPAVLRGWNPADRRQTTWHDLGQPADLWAFGPGARRAAAGSDELTLWDVAAAKRLATWPAHSRVTAVAFPAVGDFVATGHDDAAVRLWDSSRGRVVRLLAGHGRAVSAIAFSPDGKRLASAGEDREIHVWDVATGRRLGILFGHTDRIPALAWHPDGTCLVSAGWDTTARVWDLSTFRPRILLNGHAGQVEALTFSPDGDLLACADSDNSVRVWDFARSRTLVVLDAGTRDVHCLAFAPEGRRLAGGGAEHVVHLWETGTEAGDGEQTDPMASRTCVAVSAEGGRVASLGGGTALRVWDVATGQQVLSLAEAGPLRAFAASPDGRWYAGSRAVGDGPDDWNAKVLPGRPGPRTTLALWDARSGTRVATLGGQRAPVTALAFAPDSRTLASAGFLSSDVWLWHVPSGEPALLLPGVAEACSVEALAFQPQGRLLAIGSVDWMAAGEGDGQVLLWDLADREVVRVLRGGASALAFHPAGRRLAVCTLAHSVNVFDVATGELDAELLGHLDAVACVAFSPGGKWIATGGDDRTVRLWDAATGEERGEAELDTQVKALAFTPDGRRLITGNGNTSCYLLDVACLVLP